MAHRVLHAADAFWRPSNQMGVDNTNLAAQLEAMTLGCRLWRLRPGQASTRHPPFDEAGRCVVLGGPGRMRMDGELLAGEPLSAVLAEPDTLRQVFNDTDADALWLGGGGPPPPAATLRNNVEARTHPTPDR